MNIKIIGTSHIAKQSVQEIKKAIMEGKPDIVAVELDVPRAMALLHEEKRKVPLAEIFQIGIKGYAFAKIGQYVQQKLGKIVGVVPGSDMRTALELSHQEKLKIALIDQPIKVTLANLSKNITWVEKRRFAWDIISGLVQPQKKLLKWGMEAFDLHHVPADKIIEKMMGQLQLRYPSVHKTLVEDRNKFMVKKLVRIARENPEKNILVVVGAGHKKGMEELLLKVDIVQ